MIPFIVAHNRMPPQQEGLSFNGAQWWLRHIFPKVGWSCPFILVWLCFVLAGRMSPPSLVADRPNHLPNRQQRAAHRLDIGGLDVPLSDQCRSSDSKNLADQCQICRFQPVLLQLRFHRWLREIRPASLSAVSGEASLEMIGRLLGRTQIGTTQRYAHLID